MQINPVIILLGVMGHLDVEGHLATLTSENVTLQQIEAAAMSIYKGMMHARAALKDDWERVLTRIQAMAGRRAESHGSGCTHVSSDCIYDLDRKHSRGRRVETSKNRCCENLH